jgi:hypothetical protein
VDSVQIVLFGVWRVAGTDAVGQELLTFLHAFRHVEATRTRPANRRFTLPFRGSLIGVRSTRLLRRPPSLSRRCHHFGLRPHGSSC